MKLGLGSLPAIVQLPLLLFHPSVMIILDCKVVIVVTVMSNQIWSSVMAAVEWNKKEDLVAEQALKHLKQYCPLLKVSTRSSKSELALMLKVQEFCYENMNFLKSFQKIIMLLYKSEYLFDKMIAIVLSDYVEIIAGRC